MEEGIQRSATAFSGATSGAAAGTDRTATPTRRFEAPTALEISLCCEISAYAPDGDDRPLF